MNIIRDAVTKLEEIAGHTGCDHGNVVLQVNPDRVVCQYGKGACMEAVFGGKVGEFVTFEPTRAVTRLGFMFGAPLEKPAHRAAACAIMNVICGFLCISRILRSCSPECHSACRADLKNKIGEMRVFGMEVAPEVMEMFQVRGTGPADCDVLLVSGEGLISPSFSEFFTGEQKKKVICIGPSTAGVSALSNIEHWCPYGRG